ncbi:MAG: hypothetical protein OXJ56_11040, partial [Rhodospirillaceae bacterium]|nr:hypothetical protein [Rhodospirillaceae bacterium]
MPKIPLVVMTVSLALLWSPAVPAAECEDWNTREFFAAATADDVMACLETGADAQAQGGNGNRPIHLAAGFSGEATVLIRLLEAGADATARTAEYATPLHFA